ncbi:MAG: hypothetical protein DRP66_05235, partial [Planctomycetota bacterium]
MILAFWPSLAYKQDETIIRGKVILRGIQMTGRFGMRVWVLMLAVCLCLGGCRKSAPDDKTGNGPNKGQETKV